MRGGEIKHRNPTFCCDRALPSSDEVKNALSYASTPAYVFIAQYICRDTLHVWTVDNTVVRRV
jgi:hypothetical protein